ncbi:EAL domain-containing protein [Aeromonas bestiarum]|uniref:EAL domain-containing protein n=1 Tax=Aeromonas bestiarum TaxID=105751 RepID=UPI003D1FE3E6
MPHELRLGDRIKLNIPYAAKNFGIQLGLSCRFQPIVIIESEKIFGYEILSGGDITKPDLFFSSVDNVFITKLAKRQVAMLNLLAHMTDANNINFFINVTPEIINNWEFVKWLCKYSEVNICLEVDYCSLQQSKLGISQENVSYLKDHNHQVWLDDYKRSLLTCKEDTILNMVSWSGIKIDKTLLWENYHCHAGMVELVNECRTITDVILFEGIETWTQLHACKMSGCNLGQGYYWPEATPVKVV